MSRLEDLIQTLCPDGVDYKRLGDVSSIIRGVTYSKNAEVSSTKGYKILRANNITLASNTINFDDVKIISDLVRVNSIQKLKRNDIFICTASGSKDHIGKVAFVSQDLEYYFGGFMAVIRTKPTLLSRFLFHLLIGFSFSTYLENTLNSSTINNLNSTILSEFKVPFPPLPVQEEIVRILDTFRDVVAELEAEQAARVRQYEHYRDSLLIFEGGVIRKKLGEIGGFYGGLTGKTKTDFENGNKKFITYMNVYKNPAVNTEINDHVKINTNERQNTVQYGDILFTGSSETPEECGISSVMVKEPNELYYLNSFTIGFRLIDLHQLNPNFSKHLFRSANLRMQINKTAQGVTRFNVSKSRLSEVNIPIPSLLVQGQIVSILDRFDALVNDLKSGLPAEIALRRKQYEYYRDKLLTFQPLK